ncbi:MAG: LysM peptidoglycan-binding domain-containing protein [Bacillota bacterium]
MEIYVIQPGDTLSSIAGKYGVSLTGLTQLNGLPNPEQLVVGQAILIPGPPPGPLQYTVVAGDTLYQLAQIFNTTVTAIARANSITNPDLIQVGTALTIPGWSQMNYIVRPGDSLFIIADRYQTTIDLLVRVNHLTASPMIFPGQILIIPQLPAQAARKSIETLGYFQMTNLTGLRRSLGFISTYITYGALFQFPVAADGTITAPANTGNAVTILKDFNVRPLIAITNWGQTGFESELARTIMGNATVKASTINNLLSLINQYGFAGVNVDFENMYAEDRQLFNDFLSDIVNALKPQGFLTTVAVAAKFSDQPTQSWVGTFEYGTIGRIVDIVFLMDYEWGWIGGPPQAIAPINLVRRALSYAVTQIPRAKIIQGEPFYGYDWPLPHTPEKLAVPVNLIEVYDLAYRHNARINYDNTAEAPWFRYTDGQGVTHEVWFEDARSFEAKYRTTKEFDVRGAGWWSYVNEPYGFPQNWPLMGELFMVK